jgi:hypothetical protein
MSKILDKPLFFTYGFCGFGAINSAELLFISNKEVDLLSKLSACIITQSLSVVVAIVVVAVVVVTVVTVLAVFILELLGC